MKPILYISAMALIASSCAKQGLNYPKAPEDGTTYDAFGITVDDRFRPLENDTAAATLEWVKAENALTQEYLSQIPYRQGIRERLTALNNFAKTGLPSKENDGKYYWSQNSGLLNQSVIYRGSTPYAGVCQFSLKK